MDYDTVHFSLDFINTYFTRQASIYEVPIMEQKNGNSLLWGQSGKFRYEYRINDFSIATKLSLFETNLLKGEISKALSDAQHPDEVKTILQNLLKIAKENIDLYNEIYTIRYNNGSFNASFNDIPIINKLQYLSIEDNKEVWMPTQQNFNSEQYSDYKKEYYRIEDFYEYSAIFYNHVNGLIGDWIKQKELDKEKKLLEIQNLRREKWKFWVGYALGFVSSAILLLLAHYLNPTQSTK